MVELADIRRWQPEKLDEAYRQLHRAEQELMTSGDDFITAGRHLDAWEGGAAAAAKNEQRSMVGALAHPVAGVRLLLKMLGEAMDAIPAVLRSITEAEELARRYGFTVSENGTITDTLNNPGPHDPHPQDRTAAREEVRATLDQVVRTATDINADITGVLHKISDGDIATGTETTMAAASAHGAAAQALSLPEPPPGGTAAQNAAYWETLSPNAQALLLGNRPELLGELAGLPAAVRSQANMNRLPAIQNGLREQIDRLRQEQTRLANPDGPTTQGIQSAQQEQIRAQLADLESKLAALNTLGSSVEGSASAPESQRYYLLGVDADGSGKAILAKGNPDTADNVATYVPGTESSLAGFADEQIKSEKMYKVAQASSGGGTSVITWQGYEAPPDVVHAASESYATNGKAAFADFQQGLRASHEGAPSHNVAVGHSYGSTLIGHAARDGDIDTDDLVFVGSPGVGVDHASQLRVPPENVYSTVAQHDIIQLSNINAPQVPHGGALDVHGPDPTRVEFGGQSFAAKPGTPGDVFGMSVEAHGEYWDPQNPSLFNMGRIISGQAPNVG